MEYSYTILEGILDGADDNKALTSIKFNMMPKCYLIKSLSYIMSDQNPLINTISLDVLRKLFNMSKEYMNITWFNYIDIAEGKIDLEDLLKHSKKSIYHIKTYDGFRVATEGEVEAGVMELEDFPQSVITDSVYKKAMTYLWTLTGYTRYYREMGFDVTYIEGERLESDYELIVKAGVKIRELLDWMDDQSSFDLMIKQLKAAKKSGKYKYPKVVADEITPDISIKQVIFNLNRDIPYKAYGEQFKAKKILNKQKDNPKYKLTTEEKIFLRKVYYNIRHPEKNDETIQAENERKKMIKEKCESLIEGRDKGLVSKSHFAFKIVATLRDKDYKFCSKKQESILDDALCKMKINANTRDEMMRLNQELIANQGKCEYTFDEDNNDTDDEDSNNSSSSSSSRGGLTLTSLSDILGNGMMENI